MNKYDKLEEQIANTRSCVITTHENPDGDALGSELAFHLYVQSRGISSRIVNSGPCPSQLTFIDKKSVIHAVQEQQCLRSDIDTVFLIDTAVNSRIEEFSSAYSPDTSLIYAIDHHIPDRDSYSGTVDPDLSSTGELLYRYFNYIDLDIPAAIAEPLLYAIVSDTGWMRFSNTTPDILRIVAELSETAGLSLTRTYENIYSNWSDEKFYLFTDVLNTAEIYDEGIVFIHCLQKMLEKYPSLGNISNATEVFITELKTLKSCNMFILLKQNADLNSFKVSFRSNGTADVRKVASAFGGGGHKAAAGCTIPLTTVEDVKKKLLKNIKAQGRYKK